MLNHMNVIMENILFRIFCSVVTTEMPGMLNKLEKIFKSQITRLLLYGCVTSQGSVILTLRNKTSQRVYKIFFFFSN